METTVQSIPESLIYEMVDGSPIYYKGYKEYLNGTKQWNEIMGSSKLQALLVTELIFLLKSFLSDVYLVFSNELGLQFSKGSWRAADIAVIKASKVKEVDDKYLNVAPELVIEIDTKADLSEVKNPLGYYQEKTDELLNFGVQKVIWIFTDTRKVMIAEQDKRSWTLTNWAEDVEMIEGIIINLQSILKQKKIK